MNNLSDLTTQYNGNIKVVINNFIQPYTTTKQVKFPKSKNKRIRKKWAKRSCNFKTTEHNDFILWDDTIFMNQQQYDKLKLSFPTEIKNGN